MKVVLFCGGLGIRMGEATQRLPKPMIPIGGRPILWHIMRYYASFGHREFILCLGYRAEAVKEYFLTYNEAISNDFVLRNGGRDLELLSSDTEDWTITFVDTGISSTIGGRLKAVAPFLESDDRVEGHARAVGLRHFPYLHYHFISTEDWNESATNAAAIRRSATTDIRDKTVILCHEWRADTLAELPAIIRELKAQHVVFVTFSELAKLKP